MKKIGLLSDTHGWLDEAIFLHFKDCDEIWHAGDFGNIGIANAIIDKIGKDKIFRAVYGNVDGQDVRSIYPEKLHFTVEDIKVFMQHIGGYPDRYAPGVAKEIQSHQSQLFISGHSHILKIIFDPKFNCLHMNPGAAGREGWHKMRTAVRFVIDGRNIKDCEVIELGARGRL